AATDEDALYEELIAVGDGSMSRHRPAQAARPAPALPDLPSRLMYRDMARYLPGDILVKLDRASMAVSLEGRCPLLDHRVIEFAWRVSPQLKLREGRGKWLLRQVLRRYVPDSLIDRPKHGFDVPIGAWLRGPLRGWAEDLLDGRDVREHGLLEQARVQACWRDHLSGARDRAGELWSVLMFQGWLQAQSSAHAPPAASALAPLACEDVPT
ncbi:MAG: hypothetical protein JOZ05_18730, partial [Acetobacteraceae bacterium]|nr:hypothetical protein [Acetobacteraceae bacterium]